MSEAGDGQCGHPERESGGAKRRRATAWPKRATCRAAPGAHGACGEAVANLGVAEAGEGLDLDKREAPAITDYGRLERRWR
jgi:hypothetical protein